MASREGIRRAGRALCRHWRGYCAGPGGSKTNKPPPSEPLAAKKPEYLTSKEDLEGAKQAEDYAKMASAFMFPWEKRALDGGGGGLSNTEKGYWVVFGGAMLYFGFKLATNKGKSEEATEDAKREEERVDNLKRQRALAVLRGESIIGGVEDPFEGLSPEEIDEYVKSNTKHT